MPACWPSAVGRLGQEVVLVGGGLSRVGDRTCEQVPQASGVIGRAGAAGGRANDWLNLQIKELTTLTVSLVPEPDPIIQRERERPLRHILHSSGCCRSPAELHTDLYPAMASRKGWGYVGETPTSGPPQSCSCCPERGPHPQGLFSCQKVSVPPLSKGSGS